MALGHVDFMWPPVQERMCQFHTFICVAQYSPDHKALTCKSCNRVKSRVLNERTEAEFMSNFLHLNIGLAQDYGIYSLLLGYMCQLGHKSIYDLLNLAKLGSRNGLLPEGNWTPSRLFSPLQTTLDLSLRLPCAFNPISLEMQNIITEM